MKLFCVLTLFLMGLSSSAQEQTKAIISPSSDENGPALTVKFSHDDTSSFFASLSFLGTDLTQGERFSSIAYRFYDEASAAYLSDWKLYERSVSPTRIWGDYFFQTHQQGDSALLLQQKLSTLSLELRVNEDTKPLLYKVKLSDYCLSNPELFHDLTTGTSGCPLYKRSHHPSASRPLPVTPSSP